MVSAAALAVSGASLGLAIWGALQGSDLARYVLDNNHRHGVALRGALPSMVSGAWIVLGVALFVASAAPRDLRPAVLERCDALCRPLMISALLPPLWQYQPWVADPLGFLSLLVVVAIGARLSFTRALLAAHDRDSPPRISLTARVPAWAPLAITVTAVFAYAAYFGQLSVQRHHNLQSSAFDLGIFDNMFWNTVDRHSLSLPSSPADAPDFRHLERHATFQVFLFAPIYALWPRAETVLWIQAVMVALCAVPLFFLARRRLGAWSACLIAIGYLLYPPVHGPNLFDFHFIMFGPFFLWTSVVLLEARRDVLAAIAIVLTLLVREDFAAGVAMIGIYLIMTRQRPRAGLMLCAIGCAYVVAMKLFIMPGKFAATGAFFDQYDGLIPKGAKGGFGAVIRTIATNPAYTWTTLLTHDKLVYALQIATPLALLPWLRPIGWLFSVPGVLFCLLASAWPMIQISFQYTPHWTAYLFLALIVNVEWLGQDAPVPAHGKARQRAALAAFALCMLLGSHQFGGVLQQHTLRVGFDAHVFGTTQVRRDDYATLRAMLEQIPKDAKIVASETLVPHVSNRRYAYTLRNGVEDAEYCLSVTDDDLLDTERHALSSVLKQEKFGVIDTRRRFVLLRRGADPARNASVRKLIKKD